MIAIADGRRPRHSRWTLAARLSVLFLALLVLVVGAFGAAAYNGVRDAAITRAFERLAGVSRELSSASVRSSFPRVVTLFGIARDSLIVRAVAAAGSVLPAGQRDAPEARAAYAAPAGRRIDRVSDAVLTARLARAAIPQDSTLLGMHLLSANGAELHGERVLGRDSMMLATTMQVVLNTDSMARSPIYGARGQIRLWTVLPIRDNGRTIGVLAEHRRIAGSAATEGQIARLTGQNAHVYITSYGSDEWSSVGGSALASPIGKAPLPVSADTETVRIPDVATGPVYVAASRVPGTPWRIVMVQDESSIVARANTFRNQLLLIGTLLLGIGTLGAWWLIKLETRPLGALRNAADAMAGGDYTQHVTLAGAEETAALADSFNTMSMRISGVHATLAEQNAALQRANEAKARFLAVMSHELRTPLNAIGGYAQLLALGVHGPVTAAQVEGLERIQLNKEQLLHLVSDILHYSRLEATPLALARERVSVQDQFDRVRKTVADQFRRKGVALNVHNTLAAVSGDPVRVQQVLINLVTNALQFTPAGGEVELSADSEASCTMIRVRDTGVGISPEQHGAIFEPFVQADNSLTRRSGGAGLGLAIVRQLTSAMGGSVEVVSAPGQGSTFSVSLSNADPADDTVTEAAQQFASSVTVEYDYGAARSGAPEILRSSASSRP